MTHVCPAPGCEEQVDRSMLACRAHWFSIPKPLRDEVWEAFLGDGPGSEQHFAAINACIDFLEKAAVA